MSCRYKIVINYILFVIYIHNFLIYTFHFIALYLIEQLIHGACKVNSFLSFFSFLLCDVLEYCRLLETGYDITRFRTSCAAFHSYYTWWQECI